MKYRLHRLVQSDVDEAMQWYEENASYKVADEFFDELIQHLESAAENPEAFHPDSVRLLLRRANLKKYPYHFLFQVRVSYIYIVVVRHDKRHPNFGLRRKY